MSVQIKLEREVREVIKKNRWLTLSTTSRKGVPQSSVVVYASNGYIIYILTGKNTTKARNISNNRRVSVTIPFYLNYLHRMIPFAPPAAISLGAEAEILGFSDGEASELYKKVLNFDLPENVEKDSVWIRLTPGHLVTCHGLGVGLLELRDPLKAHKIIKLSN
jgi:hypothetical protein